MSDEMDVNPEPGDGSAENSNTTQPNDDEPQEETSNGQTGGDNGESADLVVVEATPAIDDEAEAPAAATDKASTKTAAAVPNKSADKAADKAADKTAADKAADKAVPEVVVVEEEDDDEEEIIVESDPGSDLEEDEDLKIADAETVVFSLPDEQTVNAELLDVMKKRKLLLYPLRMSEFSHPALLDSIATCAEFKASFMTSTPAGAAAPRWAGMVELYFKSTFAASEALESLKGIREDLTVRFLETGEATKKVIQQWKAGLKQTAAKPTDYMLFISLPVPKGDPHRSAGTTAHSGASSWTGDKHSKEGDREKGEQGDKKGDEKGEKKKDGDREKRKGKKGDKESDEEDNKEDDSDRESENEGEKQKSKDDGKEKNKDEEKDGEKGEEKKEEQPVLKPDITVEDLKEFFVDAAEIFISKYINSHNKPKRSAYILYDDKPTFDAAFEKYHGSGPHGRLVVKGVKLRLFQYRPPPHPAPGMMRLPRRYRMLLQVDKLTRCMGNKKAKYSTALKNKIKRTLDHCMSLLERDDSARKSIGFSAPLLRELRRYASLRKAVPLESLWTPKEGDTDDRLPNFLGEEFEDRPVRWAARRGDWRGGGRRRWKGWKEIRPSSRRSRQPFQPRLARRRWLQSRP